MTRIYAPKTGGTRRWVKQQSNRDQTMIQEPSFRVVAWALQVRCFRRLGGEALSELSDFSSKGVGDFDTKTAATLVCKSIRGLPLQLPRFEVRCQDSVPCG